MCIQLLQYTLLDGSQSLGTTLSFTFRHPLSSSSCPVIEIPVFPILFQWSYSQVFIPARMPSFSSLLKRSRPKRKAEHDNIANVDTSKKDRASRRLPTRGDFFRSFLGRTRSSAGPRPGADEDIQNKQAPLQSPTQGKAGNVATPTSDPNKPLPPPPPFNDSESAKQPVKADIQLKRIIQPLTLADIHKLFSGAPQFFVRSEGHHAGAPHPSVAFPWNEELEIRDLSDHGQIEEKAWGCVTTTPHIIRKQKRDAVVEQATEENGNKTPHFVPRCKERPNMLSMQGLERGTVGFQAALEVAVADALHEDKPHQDEKTLQSLRVKFLKGKKRGLRPLSEASVVSKLTEMGLAYHAKPPVSKTSVEMYTELFTQVLFPPTRVTDADDPTSFHVQIETLVSVLTEPGIWVDFSNVEWRIRLGQTLWGPSYQPDQEEEVDVDGEEEEHRHESQQFWLLLQILLSCELVVRLDAVSRSARQDPGLITAEEIQRFERDVTRPVKWSLLLARLWLENIKITQSVNQPSEQYPPEHEKRPSGWLSSIKQAVTPQHEEFDPITSHTIDFQGRRQKRQINGLIRFSRKMRWPGAERIAEKFAMDLEKGSDGTGSTLSDRASQAGTSLSMTTQRSSYFAGIGRLRRGLTMGGQPNMFHPSGWLSKSYLTGLILPGEGLSHLMMSTLLENDEVAVARLGGDANLYGGFVYSGQSFWSTACIIGRVLAAGKGASECMGWLSSPIKPKRVVEGWVSVDVELEPRSDGEEGPHAARIWKKSTVERESHVLGDGDARTILPGDFTLPPADVPDPVNLEVNLESLDLFTGLDSAESSPLEEDEPGVETAGKPNIRTYSAMLQFTVKPSDEPTKSMNFALIYDVQFVTAHPCVPSLHTQLIQSSTNPGSPAVQLDSASSGPHTLFTGHALHKSYNFSRHTLSSVVFPSPAAPPPLLSLHTSSTEIFVIDCTEPDPPEVAALDAHPAQSAYVSRKRRFGSDLEMLTRAWCAEKGYNALVSRKGRNCIACSIREARALSWKIVLRFG
ncbi:hypothetical protein VC83_00205 [Pseudogymnoascus destructans]|uniref:Uncharacterized protein n=1 Tax=Pseudogymnoascus destructans TaxID=655981 RepID=A0A177ANK7_9PEZI|nr:uncharacterized protein VC83_00205 [Pseudogymnoascus destructans]OAF62921.1 hypothetical protein VC83_00205 [Pseudogymnoascus destructans]